MQFLISDTFTDSLARLTGEEQKLVKTTVFDLPGEPGESGYAVSPSGKGQGQKLLVGPRR